MKSIAWFFVSMLFLNSSIALAQAIGGMALEPKFVEEVFMTWPWLGKVAGCVLALQIGLRGAAECLTQFDKMFPNDKDKKVISWLSQASWVLGNVLGKFGYGTPTVVVAAHVEKAIASQQGGGNGGPAKT